MIANPEDNQTGQTIDALVQTFLGKILPIREMLDSDANAAYEGDPAAQGTTEVESYYPGFEAVTVHRLAHELWNLKIPFLPRAMAERAHSSTGIDIHPGARIGREFFIDHGTGVVIGETTEIGNRVKLYQGVTLGALSFPTDAHGEILRNFKRHPTIEDDVVIYANATILGGDTVVGRGSVISADVDLRESVPPNSIVHGPEPVIEVSKRRSQA